MKTYPQPGDDVIDSRDVIEAIEELEAQLDDEGANMDEDDKELLSALRALAEEAEGYAPDWHYGATLISDDYFEQYAEELADDIGAINRNDRWPLNHIDWTAAAAELKQDYTSVAFGDVKYWTR